MTASGKLPPLLSEVTDVIRLIGNAGAHSCEGEAVSLRQAYAINDFFMVILEYLYIAPSKLKKFKSELSLFKQRNVKGKP